VPQRRSLRPLACGEFAVDDVDAQLCHRPAKLGEGSLAAELFGNRLGGGGREDAVLVAVECERQAVRTKELAHEQEVARAILGRVEAGGRDSAGGIVDCAQQDEPRPAALQPVVVTAVDLEQHPLLGIPFAARAMPGSAAANGAKTALHEDALDARAGEVDAFLLQHLAQMAGVEAGVLAGSQLDDLLAERIAEPVRWRFSPVAVHQPGWPLLEVGRLQAPRLALSDSEQRRRFRQPQLPRHQSCEDSRPLVFFLGQR